LTSGNACEAGRHADTPAVLMRHYASATEQAAIEAAAYLICRWTGDQKPSPNRHQAETPLPNSSSENTGAGGFEPPTSRLTGDRGRARIPTLFPNYLDRPRDLPGSVAVQIGNV